MGKVMQNWGECFFDHFGRYLGAPTDRTMFRKDAFSPSIQVLRYDGVVDRCSAFCSLGLTHFVDEVRHPAELFVPVDGARRDVPALVGNAMHFMVQNKMETGRGVCVGGLEAVRPGFVRQFGKSSLYLTRPYLAPDGFLTVTCDGRHGDVYLGIFISAEETRYVRERGRDAFEILLSSAGVDPYHLARPSAV